MRFSYKIIDVPHKGFGKVHYNPGDWLTLTQLAAFLNVTTRRTSELYRLTTVDNRFRQYGGKLVRVRTKDGFRFDFQTAVYIYQYIKKTKLQVYLKRRQKKLRDSYYDREWEAYISGELGTRPSNQAGYFQKLRDLRLDPFEV